MLPVVRRLVTRSAAVAVTLGALTLAGCGDDEPEANGPIVNPTAVDLTPTAEVEVARGLYKDNDPGEPFTPLVGKDEARCAADALVEEFEVDGLIALGVIDNKAIYRGQPQALQPGEAGRWIDALDSCLDLDDFMLGVTRAGVREVAPDAAGDDAAWVDARSCLDDAPEASRGVLLQQLTAKPRNDAATAAFIDCVKIAYPDATA